MIKLNLKVFDVVNCLNKNLKTLFDIFSWKKGKTLKFYRILNKEYFYE